MQAARARRGRLKLVGHTSALKFAGARTNASSSLVAQWATVEVRKKYTSEKNMLLFTAETSNERRGYIAACASLCTCDISNIRKINLNLFLALARRWKIVRQHAHSEQSINASYKP
uniref:Uncharacterized protein n=1 Tax=Trichogramma kaykai TaxID=54128 RepID=A0ABD2WSI2_9HYME